MSTTGMLTGNALTVKLWAKKSWVDAMQQAALGHMFNRGSIHFPDELMGKDAKGDSITFAHIGKLTANPIGEGGTMDGGEEALDFKSHAMVMNKSRFAVLNPASDSIEQQRTLINFEDQTRKALQKRAVELLDTSLFQQLAGANPNTLTINGTTYSTAAEKLHIQGHNTPVAPSANRIIRPSAAATDQALTSSDTITLAMIDYALELNDTSDQPIEPLDDGTFDLYLSPFDIVNLKHDAGSAIQWYTNALANAQAGKNEELTGRFKNNMVSLGKYANVNIYQAARVSAGVNSSSGATISTVRRNVLVGKDAASFASPYGGRITDNDVPMKLKVMMKDYDEYKGIAVNLLYGLRKMAATGKEDVGVMVIATYAASHT